MIGLTSSDPSCPSCPACNSTQVRLASPSARSGSVVAGCFTCGCHWLSNPADIDEIAASYSFDREAYASYVEAKRQQTVEDAYDAALDRLDQLVQSGGRALFDVGAGAGEFLALAAKHGYEPHGNELAHGAIEMAKDLTGVQLHHGDLSTIEGESLYDAATMWCVLAHVGDADALLADVFRVLKPGGVLFVQTPRWSAMDTAALVASKVTRGRFARVLDRRVNGAHMVLNSVAGLRAQVTRAGFEVVEVRAVARYSLKTDAYLGSLGVPTAIGRAAARGLDVAVDRNLFFRNVLDLYVRKPL